MLMQVIGCSHHGASIAVRERLAFSTEQAREALDHWRRVFPQVELVLLSTCNRVELYIATDKEKEPTFDQVAGFLARFHGLSPEDVAGQLYRHCDEAAVRHLFLVASSLDSMVVGEPQILAQVKQAYQLASQQDNAGPLMHILFQSALRVAKRVASDTAIHQRHVSIPSVAVADFAQQVFERFDDKEILVIGAGEMAEETLRHLQDEGASRVAVINRHF
jgi:glutamyl-tRNA reductase